MAEEPIATAKRIRQNVSEQMEVDTIDSEASP